MSEQVREGRVGHEHHGSIRRRGRRHRHPALGDRSYLVHDGRGRRRHRPAAGHRPGADPGRGPAVRITHVFETHIHNDYVTGGFALAQATGAAYHVNAADPVAFDRVPVRDGDVIEVGPDAGRGSSPPRPHLHPPVLRAGDGDEPVRGLHRRLAALRLDRSPGPARPRHTHDLARTSTPPPSGSPQTCPSDRTSTRRTASAASAPPRRGQHLDHRRRAAPQPRADPRRERVRRPRSSPGWTPAPPTTPTWARRTRAGPAAPGPVAARARRRRPSCRRRSSAGEWVVDLRARRAFAAGHVAGTLNFDLDGSFATYLGWLIPWGYPADPARPDRRAGRRGPAGAGPDRHRPSRRGRHRRTEELVRAAPLARYPVADFADLARSGTTARSSSSTCRRDRGARRPTSAAPSTSRCHELPRPAGRGAAGEVWVHCAAGYRASIAASFLRAAGRDGRRRRRRVRPRRPPACRSSPLSRGGGT